MKSLALIAGCLLMAGCVSNPPGSKGGWSILTINIQLGGSSATVDTLNYMSGTNITQRHTLPIDATISDPINATLPMK